jgi:hypothetical protein
MGKRPLTVMIAHPPDEIVPVADQTPDRSAI